MDNAPNRTRVFVLSTMQSDSKIMGAAAVGGGFILCAAERILMCGPAITFIWIPPSGRCVRCITVNQEKWVELHPNRHARCGGGGEDAGPCLQGLSSPLNVV